jgi:hypothetical protein
MGSCPFLCLRKSTCRFPTLSHGMFNRGAIELVEYYLAKTNAQVIIQLNGTERKIQRLSRECPYGSGSRT